MPLSTTLTLNISYIYLFIYLFKRTIIHKSTH